MENDEGFSAEMMQIYSNLLMQSNTMALNKMLETISAMQTKIPINLDIFVDEAAKKLSSNTPAKSHNPLSTSSSPPVHSSDEIPVDEIECDIETLVAKNFKRYLKYNKGSLDGGDPDGFSSMIAQLCANPLYKLSPKASQQARPKRRLSGSPLKQVSLFASPGKKNEEEEDQNNCKRLKTDLNCSKNNCKASQSVALNCTAVTASESNDSACVMDSTGGDASAMSKSAENLDKTSDDLNVAAEKTVSRSPHDLHRVISRPKGKRSPFSSAEAEMRFNRLKEIQRRKPKIEVDVNQLPYHSNMKRQYVAPVRTAEAQMKRDKNTIAARISRIRNKYYEQMIQRKGTELLAENINWKRKIACYRVYANKLIEMLGSQPVDLGEMWENVVKEKLVKETKAKAKKAREGKKLK